MAAKTSSKRSLWKNRAEWSSIKRNNSDLRAPQGRDRRSRVDAAKRNFPRAEFASAFVAIAALARPCVDLRPHLSVDRRTPALSLRLREPKPSRHRFNRDLGPYWRLRGSSRLSQTAVPERYHGFPEGRRRRCCRDLRGLCRVCRRDGLHRLACPAREIAPPVTPAAAQPLRRRACIPSPARTSSSREPCRCASGAPIPSCRGRLRGPGRSRRAGLWHRSPRI